MDLIVHRIKPLLDTIGRVPTQEAINELLNELECADGKLLQYFSDIILVGIINLLRTSTQVRSEHRTQLIKCMSVVIGKIRLQKPVQFESLLMCMVYEIYDATAGALRADTSEELKVEVVNCMACSARNLAGDVVEAFYTKPKVVLLAQGFFVCVEVVMKERYRKLQLAAVECIMALMQVYDGVEYDLVLRHQIANVLFVILPKTLAALCAVIHGDTKQGQALMSSALKGFSRVVCLVMQDFSEPTVDKEVSVSDFRAVFDAGRAADAQDAAILGMTAKDQEKKREFFNSVERTKEWLQAASRKMAATIKSLSKIRGAPAEGMRRELAVASSLLVEHCSKNLHHSLPDLLENLIALSQDADQTTSDVSNRALHQFIAGQKYLDVWSQLETLFYSHLLAIPRIMHQCEECAQLSSLSLLRGYLNFLSDVRLTVIVGQQHILEYLVKALLACAELELPSSLLDCEYSVPGLEATSQKPAWKQYKNLKTDRVEAEFRVVCQVIGKSVAFERIVGYILDNWLENVSNCNEFVALLAEICLGFSQGDDQKRSVAAILDELANDVHWDLEVRPNQRVGIKKDEFGESTWFEDRIEGVYESSTEIRIADLHYTDDDELGADVVTIVDAKFNVLHECLALEMVGNGALALGADFERFLFKFLHRILEKMGNRNTHLHNAGHYALTAVAHSLACRDTEELIFQNANFFIYFINKSMKQHQYSSSGLDILASVLQHSRLDSIPYLESMIRSVLEELALHKHSNVVASLNIFNVFIASLRQWQATEKDMATEPLPEATTSTIVKWLEILGRENKAPTIHPDDMGKTTQEMYEEDLKRKAEMGEGDEMPPESEKPPLPKHIELTRDIVACCLKYIPSAVVDEQALAVETVNHGLLCLGDYENELLPMVHQVWYPLTERFRERNPIVVSRCFDLLLTMGQCAKDFILQRTLKDVAPHINQFLKDTGVESSKKTKDPSYLFSQQCKLQVKILSGYADLLINLDVQERDLDKTLDIVSVYLQTDQPQKLHDAAQTFFDTVFEFDPTGVTLKLQEI